MDELEISGKRYISSRRAAKENKYHTDYIGQLIRAGKVVGQKVGRSWYVEAESLAAYLGKEAAAPVARVISTPVAASEKKEVIEVKEAPQVQVTVEVAPKESEAEVAEIQKVTIERKSEEVVESSNASEIVESEEAHRIILHREAAGAPVTFSTPKEKKGLIYFSDDEPVFPPMRKQNTAPVQYVSEELYTAPVLAMPVPQKKAYTFGVRTSAFLMAAGIVALVAVAGVSSAVTSVLVVNSGEPASAGFSLF